MEYADRRGCGFWGKRVGSGGGASGRWGVPIRINCRGGARALRSAPGKGMENLVPRRRDDRARRGNDAVSAILDSRRQSWICLCQFFVDTSKLSPRYLAARDFASRFLGGSSPGGYRPWYAASPRRSSGPL